jgi:hypothetical protein
MNDDVGSKNLWDQSVNYTKKLKNVLPIFRSLDLRIPAYLALLIYWSAMLLATFSP